MYVPPRVKVCCISSIEEARLAIAAGAAALGLVSSMPSGPGVIDDVLIAAIAACVPPPIATFLLTAHQDAASIAELHARCRTSTVQLVDLMTPIELLKLRALLPGVNLVPVIHVCDDESLEDALRIAPHADALMLDSGNPSLAIKELGGTGRTHDWQLSRRIRDRVRVPVFLAGGLTAGNVATAIDTVRPFGVDLCSSVRLDGRLSESRLSQFMQACMN